MNNYELASQEACKYDGVLLRDSEKGEFWYCVGLLIAADDIYYEVIRQSDSKRQLLSFVGDLNAYGFVPVVNETENDEPRSEQALATLQAPEWDGKRLPPVGCQCEAYVRLTGHSEGWCEVEVLKVCEEKRSAAVMLPMMSLQWATEFRPIRTNVERDKDELNQIIDAAMRSGDGDAAAAILAAGWRKAGEE